MAHPTLTELEAAANAGRLHEVIARLDPAHHIQGPLRAALRTDLAFLVAHPDALFSCLYNRLSWLGVDWRAGQRGPRHPAGAMVEGWRATRTKPWVRALRPMVQPIEEYWAAGTGGPSVLTVTAEHVFLDVGEGPAVARRWRRTTWDRTTGARSEHDHVPTTPAVEVRTHGWGNASAHDASGALLWQVPVPDSLCVYGHAVRENTLALCGIDEDGDGFLLVFDMRRRRLRWRDERGEGLYSVALGRDHIAASGGRATVVWGIGGGDPLWRVPAGLPAFDPDDGLVTLAGPVRLWGPVTAPKPGWVAGVLGSREVLPAPALPAGGLSPAAFTPLGGRLVTQSLLVDGVTGAFITELPYERPRYLEGGPPRDAVHIGDTHAVSLERGVQMWELDRGTLVVSRDKPWYTSGDRVAIAPDGERYAVTRAHGESPVTIVVTRTGASTDVELPSGVMDWGLAGLVVGGPDGVERPPRDVVAHEAEGALVFELPGGARVWFPADGALVSHPTEPVFAGPGVHVRVEGVERRATG